MMEKRKKSTGINFPENYQDRRKHPSQMCSLVDPTMNSSILSCFSSVSNPPHPHPTVFLSGTMQSQMLPFVSRQAPEECEEWLKLPSLIGNKAVVAPVSSPVSTQPEMVHHGNAGADLPLTSAVRKHDKSITPSVAAPPSPDLRNEPILTCITSKCCFLPSERGPKDEHDSCSAANTVLCDSQIQFCPTDKTFRPLTHFLSVQSLSNIQGQKGKTLTRSKSLPNMTLQTSFEDFTPDVLDQENEMSDESYSFRFCRPGLYRCSMTGLLFLMDGEGEVVYRTVPWDRRLLAQYGKKPAGPLFDITCVQQSVCQLHLPHCEISSTGGRRFLSVAHVNHDGLEIIRPHQTTETHVVINIFGFSGYGNVKDEDSPAVPIRALVLLFYRPSAAPDEESVINVLMLPKNVPLMDVRRVRKKLVGDEYYIETHSQCKLLPYQEYTLSSCPQDESVLVQPPEAEFDSENYNNFITSFQVFLETVKKHIKLILKDCDSSHDVWQTRVCLSSSGLKKPCWLSPLNLSSDRTLLDVRTSFVNGVSEPVLKSLLDHLLEREVIADSEMEGIKGIQDQFDKARSVIDSVRRKGEAASSIMIKFLRRKDPFFSEHVGLI